MCKECDGLLQYHAAPSRSDGGSDARDLWCLCCTVAVVLPPRISGHSWRHEKRRGEIAVSQLRSGDQSHSLRVVFVRRCHAHWPATADATLWIAGTPLVPSTGNHRSAETDVLRVLGGLWWSLLTAAHCSETRSCLTCPTPSLCCVAQTRTPAPASLLSRSIVQ